MIDEPPDPVLVVPPVVCTVSLASLRTDASLPSKVESSLDGSMMEQLLEAVAVPRSRGKRRIGPLYAWRTASSKES